VQSLVSSIKGLSKLKEETMQETPSNRGTGVSKRLLVSLRPKLIGTYTTPAVRKGERVSCLYRDCECVVTSFHDGRIVWPRVQPREQRGGYGLWVNEDMVQAIRTESAGALMYWFGVSCSTVWKWRKTFGVKGKFGTPGSEKAHSKASREGAKGMKAKEWTKAERTAKGKLSRKLGLKPGPRWTAGNGGWTAEQLALLGTDHDEAIAARIGRTVSAVRSQRAKRRIFAFLDHRCRTGSAT
jgi:hypothetical protein